MRIERVWLCLLLGLLLLVPACGGGGGTITVPPAVLAILQSELLGTGPNAPVDPDASATVIVQVMDNGEFRFSVTAQAAYAADITDADIRRGAPGVDGPSVVDLLGGGANFNAQTYTAAGTVVGSAALAAEIAGTPDDFYVEIRTNAAPGGLVRSQLETFDTPGEVHARLLGTNETVVADANARGAATFRVAPDGTLDYVIAMVQPVVGDIQNAHIHVGPAGIDGIIVIDLRISQGVVNAANGTISGTVTISRDTLTRIAQDLSNFYCNVHTVAVPAGVARGQLDSGTVEMWASLSGDQETVVVDANARGGASVEFFDFTTGLATLAVPQAQGIGAVNQAHIHAGAAGVDGIILIDLQAGADYNVSLPTGSADGTITYSQETFTRLLADPSGFYCNFHTAAAPAGFVRGQLTQDPQTMFAALSGAEETAVVDANAGGACTVLFNSVHECSFVIDMTDPPVGDLTGAHIHDGFAGTDGVVLVDFLNGQDVAVNGVITGRSVVSGRTFTRFLAEPDQMYINVHTVVAPAGIARGQCQHITGDTPPAGLTYTSPVTYLTEVEITQNVPASVGGAINDYAVNPPLPTGLVLDPVTGIISGTPTAISAAQDYTVTASNNAGSTQAVVSIQVDESPPATLSYATPVTYSTGNAIAPNTPTGTGGVITSYSVNPPLPTGIGLNVNTGVISGTPSVAVAAANYTVTGSNGAGSAQAVINITVTQSLLPPNISYTSPVTYTTGTAIANNTPSNSGGAVASWSISPALSTGLSFSTSTGVISGTPTVTNSQTTYTVTATNAAGSDQTSVVITVNLGAPTNLTYNPNSSLGYVTGGTFTSMTPSSSGGAVASYSISPALPAGITINATTGVIGGSPTAESGQTNYTVTATNAAGSTQATVTITVLP